MTPGAAIAICRFLHDSSAIFLWGAFGYLAFLVPAPLSRELVRRLETAGLAAIVLAALTSLVGLPLKAAMIGSGWPSALDPAVLVPLVTKTDIGTAWLAEAATAVLLVATLALPPKRRAGPMAAAAGLMLIALSLTGHAAVGQGWAGFAHKAIDAVHVLAAGAWVGALPPLAMVLAGMGRLEAGEASLRALMRFSTMGQVAVALTVLTGVLNTLLILGGLPLDWSVPYQAMLSAKIGLVLLMIVFASVNRFYFTPQLAGTKRAAYAIRRGALGEIGLGAAVIALVSVFGLYDPM